MTQIVLCDTSVRDHLLPLTFTRPVADIRIGIWTIREKWEKRFEMKVSVDTQEYLRPLFPQMLEEENLFVNASIVPNQNLVDAILGLEAGQHLLQNDLWIASRSEEWSEEPKVGAKIQFDGELMIIDRAWKIFQLNGLALEEDFQWVVLNNKSAPIPDHVTVIGQTNRIFVEPDAVIRPCIINAEEGPIYLGAKSEVMEGCMIRGGLALLPGAALKMGTKIYGPSTFGPQSKIGGEVNNCVVFGYSNKGHDGFIGNSVIGEWCNLGADTNTSNLKNNYTQVKVHNYALGRSENTGSQFCGLTMGDHAKSGINTMFNTGTVCGVFANVFGAGFPHRKIPDFGWGGSEGFKNYRLADALQVAEVVMSRRGIDFTEAHRAVYSKVYDIVSQET